MSYTQNVHASALELMQLVADSGGNEFVENSNREEDGGHNEHDWTMEGDRHADDEGDDNDDDESDEQDDDEDDDDDDDEDDDDGYSEGLPPNPKNCLAYNIAYRDFLNEILEKLQEAINENKKQQQVVEHQLEEAAMDKLGNRGTATTCNNKSNIQRPFMHDTDNMVPPANADVLERDNRKLASNTEKTLHRYWLETDQKELIAAVKAAVIQRRLQPHQNQKDLYCDHYDNAITRAQHTKDEEMKQLLEKQVPELKENIEELKSRTSMVDVEELDELKERLQQLEEELQEKEGWLRQEERKGGRLHIKEDVQEKINACDQAIANIKRTPDEELLRTYDQQEIDELDWLKISAINMNHVFSAESCKLQWKNVLHPGISNDFTREDDRNLREIAAKHKGRNWPAIAAEMGGRWSAFRLLQRYQRELNPCLETGKWVKDEDDWLKEVVTQLKDSQGNVDWGSVATYFEDRSVEQCRNRYTMMFTKHKIGRWEAGEDKRLIEAVRKLGVNNKWKVISELMGTRSAKQCRCRWFNHLEPNIKQGAWTYEEDKTLWLTSQKSLQESGILNWSAMTQQLPGRTGNQLMQRHRLLREWEKLEPFMTGLGETLIQQYIATGSEGPPPVDMTRIIEQQKLLEKKVGRHDTSLKLVSLRRQQVVCEDIADRKAVNELLKAGMRILTREEAEKQPSYVQMQRKQDEIRRKREEEEEIERQKEEAKAEADVKLQILLKKRKESLLASLQETRILQMRLDDDDATYVQRLEDITNGIFIPRAAPSSRMNNTTRLFVKKARSRKHLHDVVRADLGINRATDRKSIKFIQRRINKMGTNVPVRDLLDLKRRLEERQKRGEDATDTSDEDEESKDEEFEELEDRRIEKELEEEEAGEEEEEEQKEEKDPDYVDLAQKRPRRQRQRTRSRLPVAEQEKHDLLDNQLLACFPVSMAKGSKGRPAAEDIQKSTVSRSIVRTPLPAVFRRPTHITQQLNDSMVTKVAHIIMKALKLDIGAAKERARGLIAEQREKRAAVEEEQKRRAFEEQVDAVSQHGRRRSRLSKVHKVRSHNPRLAGLTTAERRGEVPLQGEEDISLLQATVGSVEPEVSQLNQVTSIPTLNPALNPTLDPTLNPALKNTQANPQPSTSGQQQQQHSRSEDTNQPSTSGQQHQPSGSSTQATAEPQNQGEAAGEAAAEAAPKKGKALRAYTGDKASIYNLPPLPPNRCTLTALKRLLLIRPSLCSKACFVLSNRRCKRKLQLKKNLLGPVRQTHDYHMLRSRFLSLFLWPALLSDMPVPRQDVTALTRIRTAAKPTTSTKPTKKRKYFGVGNRTKQQIKWLAEEREAQEVMFRRHTIRANERKHCGLNLMNQGHSKEEAQKIALEKFPKLDLTRKDVLLEILAKKGIDPEDHQATMPVVRRWGRHSRSSFTPGSGYKCLAENTTKAEEHDGNGEPVPVKPKSNRGRKKGRKNIDYSKLITPREPREKRGAAKKVPEDYMMDVDIGDPEPPKAKRARRKTSRSPTQRISKSRRNVVLVQAMMDKYDAMSKPRSWDFNAEKDSPPSSSPLPDDDTGGGDDAAGSPMPAGVISIEPSTVTPVMVMMNGQFHPVTPLNMHAASLLGSSSFNTTQPQNNAAVTIATCAFPVATRTNLATSTASAPIASVGTTISTTERKEVLATNSTATSIASNSVVFNPMAYNPIESMATNSIATNHVATNSVAFNPRASNSVAFNLMASNPITSNTSNNIPSEAVVLSSSSSASNGLHVSGEKASVMPGEKASVMPGEKASVMPGEKASVMPGEQQGAAAAKDAYDESTDLGEDTEEMEEGED